MENGLALAIDWVAICPLRQTGIHFGLGFNFVLDTNLSSVFESKECYLLSLLSTLRLPSLALAFTWVAPLVADVLVRWANLARKADLFFLNSSVKYGFGGCEDFSTIWACSYNSIEEVASFATLGGGDTCKIGGAGIGGRRDKGAKTGDGFT